MIANSAFVVQVAAPIAMVHSIAVADAAVPKA